jgi:hypothetical protein
MALESATYISGLVTTNPTGSDSISQGDDHIRLIKTVLKNSLPNITTLTQPIVKVTRLENAVGVNIRSTAMTDAATFSITKESATSNLLIQANIYSGLYNYDTYQTGTFQVYNATSGAAIGTTWQAGGQWNNLGATAATNNEVRSWTTMTVMESTPLAAGTWSIKIRGTVADPVSGGSSTQDSTLTVWEIEQ